MAPRGGTSDYGISNGAHRSQGTPAPGPRNRIYSQSSPEHEQQLQSAVKLELGRRQAEGGGPSLGVLSARLPYTANETLSTPMFVVCDCWRRCRVYVVPGHMADAQVGRLVASDPSGSCWAHALVHRETNKQTDRQTQQQTQFAIEATTIAGTGTTMLQQSRRGCRTLICLCSMGRSRVRPQSR